MGTQAIVSLVILGLMVAEHRCPRLTKTQNPMPTGGTER